MPDTHVPRPQTATREGGRGSARPAAPASLAPTRSTLALVTLCAAVLIAQLDTSVVNLAVDPIGRSFRADPADRHFDAAGQALGMAALGGLVVAAIEARRVAPAALGALAIAGAALVFLLVVEARRGAAALVPLRMFRIGAFRGAVVAIAAMTFGMYGVLFLLPLTWQSTGRLDALDAGLALVPMAVVFALVLPFSGSLTQRVGARSMTSGGVAVIGGGLLILGLTAFWRSVPAAEIGLILTGLRMGIATGPLLGVAVAAVPAARSGTAAALVNLARMVGATLGVAILGSVFAAAQGGTAGLRLAMLLGGLVQLAGAAVAWREARPAKRIVR